jgi:ABC-2 type transport system ATP-binding protein
MSESIYTENLTKHFETVEAVDGISFSVKKGELFGFLGPNGAGKTTTINMLTGLARPDKGSFRIGGIDCSDNLRSAQHLIGVVPDESNLYPELTGFDNLCFCASLYGIPKTERQERARQLLDMFDLSPAAQRKFGGYSKGMKRKLTIAAGIIHRPPILFLDEPTTGIDVASARQLRQLISNLHQKGTTIFLTTHYIEEAERLCERIAFIVSGRIIRIDTVEQLLQPIKDKHVMQITCDNMPKGIHDKVVNVFPELVVTRSENDFIRVESGAPVQVGQLVRFLEDNGADVTEARRIRPSLEEIFVTVTGIEAGAMHKEKGKKGGGK